jgi:hypothetical protein
MYLLFKTAVELKTITTTIWKLILNCDVPKDGFAHSTSTRNCYPWCGHVNPD